MVTVTENFFSPEQILSSGQCFRMDQAEEGVYELIAGGRYLRIESTEEKNTYQFYCTEEEFRNFWKGYFDLDSDYGAYIGKIDPADPYLSAAALYGSGIRILRQDLWEMILTFIISQQNNIRRIRRIIRILSEKYGRRAVSEDGKVYFSFPEPRELAGASEEDLRACNLGYRSRYIAETVRTVLEGKTDLAALQKMDYPSTREELMKLCGVGRKVADCICLFALHHLEAFPVDTHIKKVMETQYPEGFPFERYAGFQGVLQQYIFYYDLNHSAGSPAEP